jgi:hypothetical protein
MHPHRPDVSRRTHARSETHADGWDRVEDGDILDGVFGR